MNQVSSSDSSKSISVHKVLKKSEEKVINSQDLDLKHLE